MAQVSISDKHTCSLHYATRSNLFLSVDKLELFSSGFADEDGVADGLAVDVVKLKLVAIWKYPEFVNRNSNKKSPNGFNLGFCGVFEQKEV